MKKEKFLLLSTDYFSKLTNMPKSKSRKKKKTHQAVMPKMKPQNFIKKNARQLPVYECLINDDWQTEGLAVITVARRKSNGNLVLAYYLVDVFCLGLKNTMWKDDLTSYDYHDMLNQIYGGSELNPVKTGMTMACNVIYGAIEYAEQFGFTPQKDFDVTEYMLEAAENVDYIDIEFGKDGKPFFISGPFDNVEAITRKLDKAVGRGNYDYEMEISGDKVFNEDDEVMDFDSDIEPYNIDLFQPSVVQDKMDEMGEDDKIFYLLQLKTASVMHEMLGGNFENFDKNDDDFTDELTDQVLDDMEILLGIDLGKQTDDEAELFTNVIMLTIERIVRNKGVQFLEEKDYMPIPKQLSEAELETNFRKNPEEYFTRLYEAISLLPSSKRTEALQNLVVTIAINEVAKGGLVEIENEDFRKQVYMKSLESYEHLIDQKLSQEEIQDVKSCADKLMKTFAEKEASEMKTKSKPGFLKRLGF